MPAGALLAPDAAGRYRVERGEQYTVVTAAPLPEGWTRFYLERSPREFGTHAPTSFEQLIAPVGTTYTFTVSEDEASSNLITFDLTAARPFVVPRPDNKPELGEVVASTTFLVPTLRYDTLDTSGAASAAGSYAFLETAGDAASAIDGLRVRGAGGCRAAHPPDGRERRVAGRLLRHGGGGGRLRLPDGREWAASSASG